MSTTDDRPPLSIPGSTEYQRSRRAHRKRMMIFASGLWMVLWFPLFAYVGPAFDGLAALALSLVAVVMYLVLTFWIGFSSRFTKPVRQHPLGTVGIRERTFSYRHVGGTHLESGRVVKETDYRDCPDCGSEFVDGVREDWARQVVLFGIPLVTRESDSTYYCMSCRPAAWGKDGPTIPTCDLKYPDKSDIDAVDAW